MSSADPFAPPPPDAVLVATGRLTLDVIVRDPEAMATPRSQAGGTCGNVCANLAHLGWKCYPLTDLGDDDPGRRFCRDLERFGVRVDLIRHLDDLETPVIVHHIRQTPTGAVHSFSSRCPSCHRRLQYYEPVPLAHVEDRLESVPVARVFFFDRDSDGSLLLARRCREQGALVVYEPNYAGKESLFDEAMAVAHVLKVSRERLKDVVDRPSVSIPRLVIETHGAQGLRFRDQRNGPGEWVRLPALPVAVVRDAGGSGDWCTAGIVHRIGQGGIEGFTRAPEAELVEALRFGQALGAWNCAFEGARGGVYRVGRDRFQQDVRRILAGECFDPADGAGASSHDDAGAYCRGCGGGSRGVAMDRLGGESG